MSVHVRAWLRNSYICHFSYTIEEYTEDLEDGNKLQRLSFSNVIGEEGATINVTLSLYWYNTQHTFDGATYQFPVVVYMIYMLQLIVVSVSWL